jgi:hypothetical protein
MLFSPSLPHRPVSRRIRPPASAGDPLASAPPTNRARSVAPLQHFVVYALLWHFVVHALLSLPPPTPCAEADKVCSLVVASGERSSKQI